MARTTDTTTKTKRKADTSDILKELNTQEKLQISKAVKPIIYDALRDALVKPVSKTSKNTWAADFITKMLKEARDNPNGAMGQVIAKQILREDILADLDAQTEKLLLRDLDFLEFRVMKQCYREQQEVLQDRYSKHILVNTGRRTGKTNLAARWLVKKCLNPNTPCVYIHLKFDNAIKQMFDLVVESAKLIEFGIDKQSKNEGVIQFSNGSHIKFVGNSNKAEADKLRGFKYKGIVIDEAAYQVQLKYLVEDILTPTMADFRDSQIMMISTPPRAPKTYYEECYRDKSWRKYEWNATQNPFIPDFEEFIKDYMEKKNLAKESPFIQREIYGQFVFDTEAQVFNGYQTYEAEGSPTELCRKLGINVTNVYIGEDYGFKDYNAIIGVAVDVKQKKSIVFAERKFNNSTVTDIVNATREVYEQGKQLLVDFNANINNIGIYGDTSDKSIIYELSQTHNMPAYPCYKYDKANAIAQLSEYCRVGNITVPKDGILQDEFERTLYKRDDQDNILSEIDDDLFHPDAIMALLYASRQIHFDWTSTTYN